MSKWVCTTSIPDLNGCGESRCKPPTALANISSKISKDARHALDSWTGPFVHTLNTQTIGSIKCCNSGIMRALAHDNTVEIKVV